MNIETIKALCPEFAAAVDKAAECVRDFEPEDVMPILKALAEARQALEEISKAIYCPWPNWCDACNEPEDIQHEPSPEAKIAKAALTPPSGKEG